MNILKKTINSYLIMFSALLIIFTSCDQYDYDEKIETNAINGKELFKGIFFSEGNIASKLANFENFENLKSQFTKEEEAAFLMFQNELISQIDNKNPEYFENLKNVVATKNHIAIKNELNNSNKIIKKAILEFANLDCDAIEKQLLEEKSNQIINLNEIQNLKSKHSFKNFEENFQARDTDVEACFVLDVAVIAYSVVTIVSIIPMDVEVVDVPNPAGLDQDILIDSITDLDITTIP